MRILIALANDNQARHLSQIFRQAGMIADIADGNDPDDVQDYIRVATPYDLLVHERDLPERITQKIPSRMAAGEPDNECPEEENPRLVLRKAFATVCRTQGSQEEGIIEVESIRLHLWEDKAFFKGASLKLKPMEYRTLRTLCLHKGEYLPIDTIADHLYTPEMLPPTYTTVINRTLTNIRAALQKIEPGAHIIHSRYMLGKRIGKPAPDPGSTLKLGASLLNKTECTLETDHGTVFLTQSETRILSLLSTKRPYSSANISTNIECQPGSLPVLISTLRRKMEESSVRDEIQTIRGYGYQFCEHPQGARLLAPAPIPPV